MEKAQPQIAAWLRANQKRQADLARLLSITPQTVSRMMSGNYIPGDILRNLVALTTGLDIADAKKWQ
jgi:hypothetical protein